MHKHVVISTESRKIIGLRNKLTVFLICLIFSSVFWLITNLSTESISYIDIEVKYKGGEKGMVLSQVPLNKLEVKVKTTGFKLLKSRLLNSVIQVDVDLNKLDLSVDKKGRSFFKSSQIVEKHLAFAVNGFTAISITPDTIFFKLSKIIRKKVPVILDGVVNAHPSCILSKEPVFFPDSVWVSGPGHIVDTMKSVKTVFFELKDLRESKEVSIPLFIKSGLESMLQYQVSNLNIRYEVAKSTEGVKEIPVNLINASPGYSIVTIPSKVKVYYKVSLNFYDKVSPDMFIASVDFNQLKYQQNSAFVSILSKPPYVQILRVSPQTVDYIIRKK